LGGARLASQPDHRIFSLRWRDNTSTRPSLVPSKLFQIHQSSYHSTLYSRGTYSVVIQGLFLVTWRVHCSAFHGQRCAACRQVHANFAMFGIKRINLFLDRLMALCFTTSCAVHVWEIVYDLSTVGSSIIMHVLRTGLRNWL
jgi:hypothetical protein